MNPFILPASQRLEDWKAFRKHLSSLPDEEKLQQVVEYWAKAPLSKIAYDVEKPDTWLSPWEMVSAGDWCRNSVAIGMEFSLRLAGIDASRLELAMMKDFDISDQMLVVIIDKKYVINYTYGEVIEYPETHHSILDRWQYSGRAYTALE